MPLYTYVANFDGQSFVGQSRRSNPKGFGDWVNCLPDVLKKQVDPYHGDFEAIPNRTNVWHTSRQIGGKALTVFIVQTEA